MSNVLLDFGFIVGSTFLLGVRSYVGKWMVSLLIIILKKLFTRGHEEVRDFENAFHTTFKGKTGSHYPYTKRKDSAL